jgi:PIN domain nuclease of toxin-antitoxin system
MRLLLDTCAIIYIAIDKNLTASASRIVNEAATSGTLFISLASAWELGMLASRNRLTVALNPHQFFDDFISETRAQVTELEKNLLIDSSYLPGRVHGDPWDRMLIETARSQKLTLLTSDRAILDYGALGHVQTLAC